MSSISLRPTSTDFDQTMQDLKAILAANPAWSGNLDNQTGSVLMNFVATVNVFAQQKILRALQEAFPDTAVSDRSHYALATMQGVRVRRKSPAYANATISSPSAVAIPAYTQFNSSGVYFFNRDALFLHPNVPHTVTLWEGVVKSKEITGLGRDYQMYLPFEAGFVVSDTDVVVRVEGNQIPRTTVGIWDLSGQEGYEDRTLPDGRLAIIFGTSVYGTKPSSDQTISVVYVVTTGVSGNNAGLSGNVISTDFSTEISGNLTTALSGGLDQLPALQYKSIATQTFGTFGSAVTKRQYKTIALQYPGVVDVVMFSQREVDPTNLEWMNLIKVVPLTASSWTPTDTGKFIKYLEDNTMFSTRFYVTSPSASPADVLVRVYCYNWANLSEVKQAVEDAVTSLFQPRSGFIDYDLYKSDLSIAIRAAHTGIEYFELVTPEDDLIISAKPVDNFVKTATAGVGTLPVGVYFYGVGVNVATASGPGYIKPKTILTVPVTAASSTVSLSWSAVPNATSYEVYGRDSTGLKLMATLPASSLSFNDDGTVVPTTAVPTSDNYPVQYLTLNTLNVTSAHSLRQKA